MKVLQRCPIVKDKVCMNVVDGKCLFGIVDMTMCPLLVWGFIIGEDKKNGDKKEEGE